MIATDELRRMLDERGGGARMTIWERLFGTPERTARTLDEMAPTSLDYCYMLDALTDDHEVKCKNCMYESDRYGCYPREMTLLEWLNREVVE